MLFNLILKLFFLIYKSLKVEHSVSKIKEHTRKVNCISFEFFEHITELCLVFQWKEHK